MLCSRARTILIPPRIQVCELAYLRVLISNGFIHLIDLALVLFVNLSCRVREAFFWYADPLGIFGLIMGKNFLTEKR